MQTKGVDLAFADLLEIMVEHRIDGNKLVQRHAHSFSKEDIFHGEGGPNDVVERFENLAAITASEVIHGHFLAAHFHEPLKSEPSCGQNKEDTEEA